MALCCASSVFKMNKVINKCQKHANTSAENRYELLIFDALSNFALR